MIEISTHPHRADTFSPTGPLCDYLAIALSRPLPPEVVEKAAHHILDTVAALVTGARLPVGQAAIRYVVSQGGVPEACIAGSRTLTSAVNAALANGIIAHADETDDSHPRAIGHPGCAVVPAALAAAEAVGADGRAFLRAVVLGYDIYARTNMALGARAIYKRGHGPYSIGGAWGAAAAAGTLHGIPRARLPFLLSNVAQQTSGIATWMRDTHHVEKALHFGGMPARNGVSAASMVAHGFTGVEDPLTGRGNFMDAFSESPDRAALIDGLGERYEIMLTNIKKWCVGSPIQAPLDSLDYLMRHDRITADTVAEVVVTMPASVVDVVADRGMPDINVQHCLALMLVDGGFTFASSHDYARLQDPALAEMKRRIRVVGCPELDRAVPVRQGIVEIRTTDGRSFRRHTVAVKGVHEDPMDREGVTAKARDLMEPIVGAAPVADLIERIYGIERASDIGFLRDFLQTGAPQ